MVANVNNSQSNAHRPTTLLKWSLKPLASGVGVEGYRQHDDLFWHSTAITRRISEREVQTMSGSIYRLEGPVDSTRMQDYMFAENITIQFADGFPQDWQDMLWRSTHCPEPDGNCEVTEKKSANDAEPAAENSLSKNSINNSNGQTSKKSTASPTCRTPGLSKEIPEIVTKVTTLVDSTSHPTTAAMIGPAAAQPKVTAKGVHGEATQKERGSIRHSSRKPRLARNWWVGGPDSMDYCGSFLTERVVMQIAKSRKQASANALESNEVSNPTGPQPLSVGLSNTASSVAGKTAVSRGKAPKARELKLPPMQQKRSLRKLSYSKKHQADTINSGETAKQAEKRPKQESNLDVHMAQMGSSEAPTAVNEERPLVAAECVLPCNNEGSSKVSRPAGRSYLEAKKVAAEQAWGREENKRLQRATKIVAAATPSYWTMVAEIVATRTAEECHQHARPQDFAEAEPTSTTGLDGHGTGESRTALRTQLLCDLNTKKLGTGRRMKMFGQLKGLSSIGPASDDLYPATSLRHTMSKENVFATPISPQTPLSSAAADEAVERDITPVKPSRKPPDPYLTTPFGKITR